MEDKGRTEYLVVPIKIAGTAALWLGALPFKTGTYVARQAFQAGQGALTELRDPFQNHPETRHDATTSSHAWHPPRRPTLHAVPDTHLGKGHD